MHDHQPGQVAKNVQIRNLDDATYEKQRARAAASGLSLTQYLRREAAYIALAEHYDVPLLTCDAKLGHAHGHDAEVLVYPRS